MTAESSGYPSGGARTMMLVIRQKTRKVMCAGLPQRALISSSTYATSCLFHGYGCGGPVMLCQSLLWPLTNLGQSKDTMNNMAEVQRMHM